ncbi:MAG: FAD-binding oxidoreductase [Chloroflexi bacterium]|nr:FAD-binding oxidoreductase [Chloroflexota bacterium]
MATPPLPTPGLQRSWWLREALAAEGDPTPLPALTSSTSASVVIVGGGYTGLWSAWFLSERMDPEQIVILEQDICGGGPSGRNGGFVHGWWEDLPDLIRRYGAEGGLAMARAADEPVAGIGAWCTEHGVDAWHTPNGYLRVNAFPGQGRDWDDTVAAMAGAGVPDELRTMEPQEVQVICSSPAFRDGLWMRSAASIQPARLARGLRRVLLERGVRIHEATRVQELKRAGASVRALTHGGEVTADHAILGINAWASGWPGFRHRLVTWGSYMILTEPIPDRLEALGWTGGELLSDSRFTISYFRTTRDHRIAFGAGVGAAGFGGRIGQTFTHDARAVSRVHANFRHLLPMLDDVRIDDAWGGPIDVTGRRFPEIGTDGGGRMHFAHGFAGNGAGPARLAGRILASLVDGAEPELTALSFVGRRQPLVPPEPIRWIGARAVREALIRQDDALDAGRRPSWLVRFVARLPRLLGYQIGH